MSMATHRVILDTDIGSDVDDALIDTEAAGEEILSRITAGGARGHSVSEWRSSSAS